MAALNRFISRLGKWGLPFFKLLKRQDKFQWTEEAKQALQDLKHHLQLPPILMAPLPCENVLLYIIAMTHVISTAIVVERSKEGYAFGVQQLVYFISKVFSESKVHYPSIQKLLYAILITSRKLRHCFNEYKISAIPDFPLADVLHNRDATGRISKWAMELGGSQHQLQASHRHQVTSTSRFHGRVARKSSRSSSQHARALGHVLRWFSQAWRPQRRSSLHLTKRRTT
jgi:hypothetical protein